MKLSKTFLIISLLVAALALAACGKKGELEPPTRSQVSERVTS